MIPALSYICLLRTVKSVSCSAGKSMIYEVNAYSNSTFQVVISNFIPLIFGVLTPSYLSSTFYYCTGMHFISASTISMKLFLTLCASHERSKRRVFFYEHQLVSFSNSRILFLPASTEKIHAFSVLVSQSVIFYRACITYRYRLAVRIAKKKRTSHVRGP